MPKRLPEFYAITAPLEGDGSSLPILDQVPCRDWLGRFEKLLSGGIELAQLRVKSLEAEHMEQLARCCQACAAGHGARLLLNGPAALAARFGMAGVHLTTRTLMALTERPLPRDFLVGASCHSARELAQAEAIGADFACLSPIRPTKGYAAENCLGLEGFAEMVANCRIPVYALGGLGREDLSDVQRAGGQGVAGISAFWRHK